MNYEIPKYCEKISVNIPCDRKGGFCIKDADIVKQILEVMTEETVFSTVDGNCTVTLTPDLTNNVIKGSILTNDGECHMQVDKYLKNAPLCVHFWDKVIEFTLRCPYAPEAGRDNSENARRTWLCLDLGNTRTCALLDLPDDDIAFYDVKFQPRADKNNVPMGIVESLCATVKNDNDDKKSFVTFGRDALYLRQQNKEIFGGERTVFSSPKRFFWDERRDKAIKKLAGDRFEEFGKLGIFENELLENESYCSPKHVFQSSIIELLEQASATLGELKDNPEKKLNEYSSFGKTLTNVKIDSIRRDLENLDGVTDLVFTYPAAWTMHERALYFDVMKQACQIYNGKKGAGCRNFRVNMSCDEATAVLMYYIKDMIETKKAQGIGEQRQNHMVSWIYENGKIIKDSNGSQMKFRIGVIDIGGGTSDLTIAEMRSEVENNRLKLRVKSLYSNGTHDAGDKFLLSIIQKLLLEMVARSFLSEDGLDDIKKEEAKAEFMASFKECIQQDDMKRYARSFWFNLAIEAIGIMEKNRKSTKKLAIERASDAVADNVKTEYKAILRQITQQMPEKYKEKFNPEEWDIKIEFPKDWEDLYQRAIEETFAATAALMSSALLVHDCDMLLFSGKTMENQSICEFFKGYLAIPSEPLANPKKATAIGAEYFARKNDASMELGIEIEGYNDTKDENFYWYVPVNTVFGNQKCDFSQREDIKFPISNREIVIYRKKFNTRNNNNDAQSFTIPSYRLNLDDRYAITNSDTFDIHLAYSDNKLKLKSVTKDGENWTDKWTLSVCMLDDREQSWLDSGKIIPQK